MGLLAPGGTLVMDDLTPGRGVDDDPVRGCGCGIPALACIELQLSAREAAIVGVLQSRGAACAAGRHRVSSIGGAWSPAASTTSASR